MRISGYRRPDGTFGIRNHLVILPVSVCAGETAVRIAGGVPGSVPLPHQHGCCQMGEDFEQTVRTLVGIGRNPNTAAVLVVALGCEGVRPELVADAVRSTGKPVDTVVIRDHGGSSGAAREGVARALRLLRSIEGSERVEAGMEELVLGLECGGSDATSGLAANPALGAASDLLIACGGTVILSETTELIGAEHLLARRAVDADTASRLLAMVKRVEERALRMGVDMRGSQPTPGNILGGISTIEEKSLGCIYKAGTSPIRGVLAYGEAPPGRGLYVMDTPGQDIESITGMLAGGARIVLFSTGTGTPAGSPVAPVIKVTGNSRTYASMRENTDIDAGRIIDGSVSIERMGREIFEEMAAVSRGRLTRSELLGHREFAIHRAGPTF